MDPNVGFETKTEKGLKISFFGLILFCLAQLIGVIVLFLIRNFINDLATMQSEGDFSALEGNMDDMGAFCGYSGILVLSLLIIVVGLIYLIIGRNEFGEQHANNVIFGFILLIAGLIAGFAIGTIPHKVALVSVVVSAICYGLGMIFILKKLLNRKKITFLKISCLILFIISMAQSILFLLGPQINSDFPASNIEALVITLYFSGLNIIPWVMFSIAFYWARKRIREGAIKPIIPSYPIPVHEPIGDPSQKHKSINGEYPRTKKCPSCGFMHDQSAKECPKCGFYHES